MIIIDDKYISDEIVEEQFVCNLSACKGACCVAGDCGAPLTKQEIKTIKKIYPTIKPYLRAEGIAEIEKTGYNTIDDEYGYVTPIVNGGICAYATVDENGITGCGIEKAYNDKKVDFKKPISCHLYPIRITKYDSWEAVNYDRWDVCKAACKNGKALKVPVYRFLRDAIIRHYGQPFYDVLDKIAQKSFPRQDQ